MTKKIAIFIIVILNCLTPIKASGQPARIYLDIEVRTAGDLKISKEDVRQDLVSGMEHGFSKRGTIVVKEEKRSDFTLTGTVFVKHFIKNPSSYSIIFKAKHFKIASSLYWRVIPALVYDTFTNRDRSGGITPRQDLDDALDISMKDLLFVMDKKGIFNFDSHGALGKVIDFEIEPENFKQIINREGFEQLVDRMVQRLSIALNVTVNAHISGPGQQSQPVDMTGQLEVIIKEIRGLKNDNRSLKQKIETLNASINRANYLNTGSIIVNIPSPGSLEALPRFFPARIIPDGGCHDCIEPHIKAVNLGALLTGNDFDRFAQDARYRIPYWMKGKLQHRDGRYVVVLSKTDYRKIFDIDKNCRLPNNEILNSVKTVSKHPRILVKVKK